MNNPTADSILSFYKQQNGAYTWHSIADILNTNKGTAWAIAHGKRPPTQEQELRWLFWMTFGPDREYHTLLAIPCPTCGHLHQVDDCHGQAGEPVIVPAGARIVQPKPAQPKRLQDMSIAVLTAAILHRVDMTV